MEHNYRILTLQEKCLSQGVYLSISIAVSVYLLAYTYTFKELAHTIVGAGKSESHRVGQVARNSGRN